MVFHDGIYLSNKFNDYDQKSIIEKARFQNS